MILIKFILFTNKPRQKHRHVSCHYTVLNIVQISMSVLRTLMVVHKSAQILPEVIGVHVAMGTACQAMASCAMVSN